jgi:hypothetical protein
VFEKACVKVRDFGFGSGGVRFQFSLGVGADRLLPGARLFYHWLWSYTIVWDKPRAIGPETVVVRELSYEIRGE